MKMHVYRVWLDRLHDDNIFDEDASSKKAGSTIREDIDIINEDNLTEFLEALDVQDIVSEDDLRDIIEKNCKSKDEKDLSYAVMKEKLYEHIVEHKKASFNDLVHTHFSLPVDRVSRLIDMLQDEYSAGETNELKKFILGELKFAQEKISRQELFQATKFEIMEQDKHES